jgi:hypothetical protein
VGERLKGIATVADINCDKWDEFCDDIIECNEYPGLENFSSKIIFIKIKHEFSFRIHSF